MESFQLFSTFSTLRESQLLWSGTNVTPLQASLLTAEKQPRGWGDGEATLCSILQDLPFPCDHTTCRKSSDFLTSIFIHTSCLSGFTTVTEVGWGCLLLGLSSALVQRCASLLQGPPDCMTSSKPSHDPPEPSSSYLSLWLQTNLSPSLIKCREHSARKHL